jgi:hypothetical protein
MKINEEKIAAEQLIGLARNYNDSKYRRGYVHGYLQAIRDKDAGNYKNGMLDFVDEVLMEWRRFDTNLPISPPQIGSKAVECAG